MRKMVFAFAALAALGLTLPLASTAKAEEGTVMIKTGDRDHNHDRRWHRDRDHRKVAMIKTGDRDQDHDRRWHRDRDHRKVVVIKKHTHRDHDND